MRAVDERIADALEILALAQVRRYRPSDEIATWNAQILARGKAIQADGRADSRGGDRRHPAVRRSALELLCRTAGVRFDKVNVPIVIRDALERSGSAQGGSPADREAVHEAIGVLTGCDFNEFVDPREL